MFYQTDALLRYGIAYASAHYEDLISMSESEPFNLNLRLPSESDSSLAGLIVICNDDKREGLVLSASLINHKQSHPVHSCLFAKNKSFNRQSDFTITSWAFNAKNKPLF